MSVSKINIKKIIAEGIYLFLIFFFCYTAANKLVNIDSFRTNLIKTTIFNKNEAHYFSWFVIFLEIMVILFLIFKKQLGLIIFISIMLLFTLYISYLKYNQLYEVCGCGGVLNGLDYKYHFIINLGLIFGGQYCFYINTNEK